MSAQLVTGTHWLEPLLPSPFPSSILALAEQLPFQAGKLAGMLPAQTAACVGDLLRVTSSFYSNLIEGPSPGSRGSARPASNRKQPAPCISFSLWAKSAEPTSRCSPDSATEWPPTSSRSSWSWVWSIAPRQRPASYTRPSPSGSHSSCSLTSISGLARYSPCQAKAEVDRYQPDPAAEAPGVVAGLLQALFVQYAEQDVQAEGDVPVAGLIHGSLRPEFAVWMAKARIHSSR